MSPVGKTRDAGWEIGVSRVVHAAPEIVWDALTSAPGLHLWLGAGTRLPMEKGTPYETADGTVGEVRSHHPRDRIRLTMRAPDADHETTLQVTIRPGAHGTTIGFHQERLADADERERQRAHWKGVLDALEALLAR